MCLWCSFWGWPLAFPGDSREPAPSKLFHKPTKKDSPGLCWGGHPRDGWGYGTIESFESHGFASRGWDRFWCWNEASVWKEHGHHHWSRTIKKHQEASRSIINSWTKIHIRSVMVCMCRIFMACQSELVDEGWAWGLIPLDPWPHVGWPHVRQAFPCNSLHVQTQLNCT